MNLLLVIRSEIISIFILIFFIVYDRICAKYREGKDYFLGFALAALGHVVFALITEITVNTPECPALLNDICHVIFFFFALLFSLRYFEYALSMILPRGKKEPFMVAANILSGLAIVVMLFSDIDYLQGVGTKYSSGAGPTMCYMLGFVLFVAADVIFIINRKIISRQILFTILPLSFISLSFEMIQIIVPEFLFTGCALTLTAVGVFFAIENPIEKFSDRAFIDMNTRLFNRSCYDFDLNNKIAKVLDDKDKSLIYVMADIDGLKYANDNYGHLEGDKLIEAAAEMLSGELKSADKIYRIGGDEFAAIYIDQHRATVENEIKAAQENMSKYGNKLQNGLSMSLGYAEHIKGEDIEQTVRRADLIMYQNKELHHKSRDNYEIDP